jgi:hypothetical protein
MRIELNCSHKSQWNSNQSKEGIWRPENGHLKKYDLCDPSHWVQIKIMLSFILEIVFYPKQLCRSFYSLSTNFKAKEGKLFIFDKLIYELEAPLIAHYFQIIVLKTTKIKKNNYIWSRDIRWTSLLFNLHLIKSFLIPNSVVII